MSLMNDNGILKSAIGTYYNYVDVNNSTHLRKNMVKYYREKTKKWLINDYQEITDCFKVTNQKIIKNNNCSSNNNEKDTEKIANYIYEKIYNKKLIKKILLKYTKIYNVNWYDLKLEKKQLKKLIKKIIKKKLSSSK